MSSGLDRSAVVFAAILLLGAGGLQADWVCNGVPVCSEAGHQVDAQIISDGAGGAIMVWRDGRGVDPDIYAQRIDGDGNVCWDSGGVAVCTAPSGQYGPKLVSDGAGGAIIVWGDYRNTILDLYAQRLDSGGLPLWTPQGVPVCTKVGDQRNQAICSDGFGGDIIAWEDRRLHPDTIDIYAQRLDPDGEALWAIDGEIVCHACEQRNPDIAVDGSGGAIVTWVGQGTGITDIYAQRINAGGTTPWGPDGVVCSGDGPEGYPSVVSDGVGGAIVTWWDYRDESTSIDIYAQRVSGAGVRRGPAGGVPVSVAADNQSDVDMVADGSGGAILVWRDRRNYSVSSYDVYAQRLGSDGEPAWATDGIEVCGAEGSQEDPELISDGSGGAVITWYDSRDDNNDIYAQKIDAVGVPGWVINGLPVCVDSHAQAGARIAPDGFGGGIIAWVDTRGGNKDIYASNTADWSGIGLPTEAGKNLARCSPNPFCMSTTAALYLGQAGNASAGIYDISGRLVRVLAEGQHQAGEHRLIWDGRDPQGTMKASGIYFLRVETAEFTETRKLVFVR